MRYFILILFCIIICSERLKAELVNIYKTTNAPVIDGKKENSEPWVENWISLNQHFGTTSAMNAKFQMCYDDEYLYIIVEVNDSTNSFKYDNDSVIQDVVTLSFAWNDNLNGALTTQDWIFYNARNNSETFGKNLVFTNVQKWVKERNFKVSCTSSLKSYVQEWQIPWADITYLVNPAWNGKMFRFEISASDFSGDSITQKQFWNSDANNQLNNTNNLGYVYLEPQVIVNDSRSPQTLYFAPIGDRILENADFLLYGNTSSGLPILFWSYDTSVIAINGNGAHINGPGFDEITAFQPGDKVYRPAEPVYRYMNVGDVDLTIYKTKTPPVIDGKMSEGEPWTTNAKNLEFSSSADLPSVQANFQMCYDDSFLYVLVKVFDGSPCNSCSQSLENDGVELCFSNDIYRNKNLVLLKKAWNNDNIFGSIDNTNFNFSKSLIAEVDNTGSYTQEWEIPWSVVTDSTSLIGKAFKFNVRVRNNISPSCSTLLQNQVWNLDDASDPKILEPYGLIKLSTDSVFPVDEICLVTVDSKTNKNVISWYKTHYQGIKAYNIYKETSKADEFIKIGTVSFSQPGQFIDETSDPFKHADSYKLETINENEESNGFSLIHKTIHLSINAGKPGVYNLLWTEYAGFDFDTYYIFKGTSPNDLALYDSVSKNILSYSDKAVGSVYYRIGVISNSPCPFSSLKSGCLFIRGKSTVSMSNIESTEDESIKLKQNITITPNPFENEISITLKNDSSSFVNISIYSLLGRKLYEKTVQKESTDFTYMLKASDIAGISKVNFIKINAGNSVVISKLIKK